MGTAPGPEQYLLLTRNPQAVVEELDSAVMKIAKIADHITNLKTATRRRDLGVWPLGELTKLQTSCDKLLQELYSATHCLKGCSDDIGELRQDIRRALTH